MRRLSALIIGCMSAAHAEMVVSGVIISEHEVALGSRATGYIKEMRVNEGDVVQKGALLYVIDSKESESAKEQSRLAIIQAELTLQTTINQYNNTKLNVERHQRLLAQDMVSKSEVETLELSLNNLKAMVDMGKKQVEQAKLRYNDALHQFDYLNVKAPVDGLIIKKSLNAGDMAQPGLPALVLSNIHQLKMSAELAESFAMTLNVNDTVRIEVPSIGCVSDGHIESIVPTSNPQSHTFRIKSTFTCEKQAYPGMYALLKRGEK